MENRLLMVTIKDFRYLKEIFTQNIDRIFSFSFPMETEGCHLTLFNTFTLFSDFSLFGFLNSFFCLRFVGTLYKDDLNDCIDVLFHIL